MTPMPIAACPSPPCPRTPSCSLRALPFLALLFMGTLAVLCACRGAPAEGPTFLAELDGRVDVLVDGELFASVVTQGAQSPYVYPLLGPGGVPMTRGFPMDPRPGEEHDHPHHRSFWLSHGDVNGVDFWHEGERPGRIETRQREIEVEEAAVRVTLELVWKADDGRALLEETRTLVFRDSGSERWIDVESSLRALDRPVTLGDTKEGTLALRVHPALRTEGERARGSLRNSEGRTGTEVWGKRARWVHASGPVDGRRVGIALFDHPSNPRHPTWWHARTYGLLAANPFGAHDFEGLPEGTGSLELPAGSELGLFYRVLLHSGERSAQELEADFAEFAAAQPRPRPQR